MAEGGIQTRSKAKKKVEQEEKIEKEFKTTYVSNGITGGNG